MEIFFLAPLIILLPLLFFININDELHLNVLTHFENNTLTYKVLQKKEIKSIVYMMELLNLHKDVKYWAYEAIDFSTLQINSFHGWVDLNNTKNAYKNIYANVTGYDLNYAYHKKLDSIHSKETNIVFENGILKIYPKQTYTYKAKLGASWLKIDFTKKEELLTLRLLFDGKLNKNTLSILKQYKINVPFLQNTGVTQTDLTIKVGLRNIKVDAHGTFFTKKANFTYRGYDIDVLNTTIYIDNYDVRIPQMKAQYKNIMKSDVNVVYNASKSEGKILFNITSFLLKDKKVALKSKKVKATYIISPKKDMFFLSKSNWLYKDLELEINKISLPFNIDTLKISLPKTFVKIKNIAELNILGKIDLNKIIIDLNIEPISLDTDIITLKKPSLNLNIKYDKYFQITSKEKINFLYKKQNGFINPFAITMNQKQLSVKEFYINIDNLIKSKLSATYSFEKEAGTIITRRMRLSHKNLGLLYFNQNKVNFEITKKDGNLFISSPDMKMNFQYNTNIWNFELESLAHSSINSPFLKKYFLTSGNVILQKKKKKKNITLKANIHYPYKLIVQEKKKIDDYIISAQINTKTMQSNLKINEDITINIEHDKDILIQIKNLGFNTSAIVAIINSLNQKSDTNTTNTKVFIHAKNSYLYISDKRKVLSDNIYLYYDNNTLTACLLHKDGVSGLKIEDKKLNAYGMYFNDIFMENLFSLSKFKNGTFEFTMTGDVNEYQGLFRVKDTVMLDYKVFNNILAFVNTIPSLVTFSTPGYTDDGLKIKTAYMSFTSLNSVFNIDNIYLNSQELDIAGKGNVNLKKNTINIELNLKSALGSHVSQVPLVGYILLDKENISTTLSVKGALNNPTVESVLAKDIVVAPLNIILRTLTLPYYLISNIENNTTK
ncbi:AsmA-like C-terminal domain-containing protein [Sulfurimonas sp. SAG-AH-194-I05]|nr:AsmA-like C-terminal domain-containing protein [Sulfurimonas sp. SAG-AH-194-I05]MDF1875599.1 AsmA-like C-terminal domain-containing protein [Sulfurimonas sp. SAG-AH-194-I05]